MKVLLDTQAFLWYVLDDPKLSAKALAATEGDVVGFSTDAAGASPIGTAVTTVKPLHLNAHKSLKVHVALTKAQLASLASGDSYYLVITDSDNAGNSASVISSVPFIAG